MELQSTTDLGATVEDFLTALAVDGRGTKTIGDHRFHLRDLASWLDEHGHHFQTMTKADMRLFLAASVEKSYSYRSNRGCTMRMFFTYCTSVDIPHASPHTHIRTPKKPRIRVRALTREQIRALLAVLRKAKGETARRDEALIITGLYTGFRASELAALRWNDIDFEHATITVRDGKTGGQVVALHAVLADVLLRWHRVQKLGSGRAVFSLDGEPIVPNRVGKICRRISTSLDFDLQSHALRHSAATWAIRNGAGIWNVSRMLGHHDTVITSKVYLAHSAADSKAAVDALPDLGAW